MITPAQDAAGWLPPIGHEARPCVESVFCQSRVVGRSLRGVPKEIPDSAPVSPRTDTDIPLDEFLRFSKEHKQQVDEGLIPDILKVEERKRDRRDHDRIAFGFIVSTIAANALKAASLSADTKVHYSRRRATYSDQGKGLYYPSFIGSKALCRTIDAMAMQGWLETTVGNYDHKTRRGTQSTFKATNKLIVTCLALGINHHHTCRDGQPVLRLKDHRKKLVSYDRADHRRAIDLVSGYNKFIAEQTLSLQTLPAEEWERARNNDRVPDFSETSLYRVFNNSDWRQGGRFYGGWWQSIFSEWRKHIVINWEQTVELDYSGFLTRALYHSSGLDFEGDPYDIKPIRTFAEKKGADWEVVRTNIKLATNILINAKPGDGLGRMSDLKMPKGLSKKKAFQFITEHHQAIANKFRCGAGLRIMYRESSICQAILTDGVKRGIPVLPVHDSYLVQSRHRNWLRGMMISCYQDEFGYDPVIKGV